MVCEELTSFLNPPNDQGGMFALGCPHKRVIDPVDGKFKKPDRVCSQPTDHARLLETHVLFPDSMLFLYNTLACWRSCTSRITVLLLGLYGRPMPDLGPKPSPSQAPGIFHHQQIPLLQLRRQERVLRLRNGFAAAAAERNAKKRRTKPFWEHVGDVNESQKVPEAQQTVQYISTSALDATHCSVQCLSSKKAAFPVKCRQNTHYQSDGRYFRHWSAVFAFAPCSPHRPGSTRVPPPGTASVACSRARPRSQRRNHLLCRPLSLRIRSQAKHQIDMGGRKSRSSLGRDVSSVVPKTRCFSQICCDREPFPG